MNSVALTLFSIAPYCAIAGLILLACVGLSFFSPLIRHNAVHRSLTLFPSQCAFLSERNACGCGTSYVDRSIA